MKQYKISDYIIDFFIAQGLSHVFLVSGGASIHLLHSANNSPGILPIPTHHEQGAAMAADGYARSTGFIGLAVATSGPGATNLITGIAGAWFDSIPCIFISGQLPITKGGEKLTGASFKDQTIQVLENLKCALESAGGSIQSLLQVRVYLDDINNWPEFNSIYAVWAGESMPARAVIPTGPLHFGLKIEIGAIASQF